MKSGQLKVYDIRKTAAGQIFACTIDCDHKKTQLHFDWNTDGTINNISMKGSKEDLPSVAEILQFLQTTRSIIPAEATTKPTTIGDSQSGTSSSVANYTDKITYTVPAGRYAVIDFLHAKETISVACSAQLRFIINNDIVMLQIDSQASDEKTFSGSFKLLAGDVLKGQIAQGGGAGGKYDWNLDFKGTEYTAEA